jgi:large subunit ribosomal protein L25
MKTISLKLEKRKEVGKKETKELRRKEFVPCVLYGGTENLHLTAHNLEFKDLIYTPHIYKIDLEVEGKTIPCIMKDIQFHPVTDSILHIDFLEIFEDKMFATALPVRTTGMSPGVKEGGKLKIEMRKLKVKGYLKDIPDELVVDISTLELGKTIKVKEMDVENIEFLDPGSNVVLSVKLTRVAKGMAAGDEGEEGEEGEGEEGGEAEATEE